jgi:hypothetical protein
MTKVQLELLDKLEFAIASMVHDGKYKWATALNTVVEPLQNNEPVIAVLEGESIGLSEKTLDIIRKTFDVRKWA